jgi:hypothetical protein
MLKLVIFKDPSEDNADDFKGLATSAAPAVALSRNFLRFIELLLSLLLE